MDYLIQKVKGWAKRANGRHFLELVKFLEIELLGKYASTYCYHHPSNVLIELTTRCNLRCQWCNQSDPEWQKQFGHIDFQFEKFDNLVSQLKGSKVLLLYNIGEPLLFKNIYSAIKTARKYIPEIRITTNAMLLDESSATKLAESGLTRLNVSIDSPDAALMERIRTGASMKKIEDNIRTFGEVCDVPIEIWSVIGDVNIDSLSQLPDWAIQFPAIKSLYFQLQNGVEAGDDIGMPPISSREKFEALQKAVGQRCRELGLSTNIESLPYYLDGFHDREAEGICKAPFNQLVAINVNGQLAPCCSYATVDLGNVADKGFKEVWNGKAARAWRKDMLNQKYCSYCSEWCGYRQRVN